MNIILFEPGELPGCLPLGEARAKHLLEILKLTTGERFLAGEVGGKLGTVRFDGVRNGQVCLADPELSQSPRALAPIRLLIGTPRPPTARRLLKDLTTLGASELHFVATDLGDKSYLQSRLWEGDWREALKEGAAQDRNTQLPEVQRHSSLRRALETLQVASASGVWFDAPGTNWLESPRMDASPLWLAIGPERGWSAGEKTMFEAQGWRCASLGGSVLRTETACALALGIARLRWPI